MNERINWVLVEMSKERYQALLQAAELNRRLRPAAGQTEPLRSWRRQVLARLGRWLVAWGCRLQERYEPLMEVRG